MEKISNYRVVYGETPTKLANEVSDYIGLGWQPIGGICAVEMGLQTRIRLDFYQAMVKYE